MKYIFIMSPLFHGIKKVLFTQNKFVFNKKHFHHVKYIFII